ncbi:hypothetical protein SERLA73DRAFT_179247 [Serpula lacrymans var. lacrymans S7.3]|uniref:Uncharacterized protein n=2 Tax=Serpula lacrymans var. lacrymans TaxID=341189 RepID=F8PRL4_SERL3|nr:uncharacterized protein SERLADRAFT_464269 [Serpula lacrymans var. lacrymans S7.9]EGO01153.1 hypothetical protein SERLA73DRAFT_179247 [Serpula lacrymans var. lacrymans S7.3]EGO26806.1 hypothetical protein SERLADRAFT_464269 [Serpula lacrymans var. lacrymans S7.9]
MYYRGVVPSLFYLHSKLEDTAFAGNVHIVYWKTYMPPRHLLGVQDQEFFSRPIVITDLAGARQNDLRDIFYADLSGTTFLVTTAAMHSSLPQPLSDCLVVQHRIFPHLDLDHLSESVEAGWSDGLSLLVYLTDHDCIANRSHSLE